MRSSCRQVWAWAAVLLAALCLKPGAARAQAPAAVPEAMQAPVDQAPAETAAPPGQRTVVTEGTEEVPATRPEETPLWQRVPPIPTYPRPGYYVVLPTGPGYYSLWGFLRGNYRQGPPPYPYPRFGIMATSFFTADVRYLENPNNTEHDLFDPLKRVHLGDDFLFSTGGEFRVRYNNEVDSRLTGVDNTYELTRTRLYGDFWYRDRFRVYAEFLSANVYNNDLPPLLTDRDHGDLLNLFTDIKLFDLNDRPVYFRGGRQELLYGSQRLISTLDWVNTRRTFEGVKTFWHTDKFDIDLFCTAPVVPNAGRFDSIDNKQIFTGLWTTYRPVKGQAIDAYYLNLDHGAAAVPGLGSTPGPSYNVNTVGGRYDGTKGNWLWDLEGAFQFGSWGSQGTLARMYTTGGGYVFRDWFAFPQIWLYYDYASGAPSPGPTTTHRTFNQLFPFGHPYFGYIDVVGRQNINDFHTQLSFNPTTWITCWAQYHVFRLDSPRDALYNAGGVPIRRDPTGAAGSDVGDELDLLINFHLTRHQDVFVSYSHLYAGEFLKRTGSPKSPDYLYVKYTYRW
jgi:hypothetical protein